MLMKISVRKNQKKFWLQKNKMFPELHIFSVIIPMYVICVATGFLVGTIILYLDFYKIHIDEKYVFRVMCFVEIGVIIGGKLLYLVVNISKLQRYFYSFGFAGIFTKSGFVFYGGLLVGILSVWIFSKVYKQSFTDFLIYELSVASVIHAFGRLGCFFAGCCYGIRHDGLLSIYINGAKRFPVQLLESFLLIFLFFILQLFLFKRKSNVIPSYFFGYGLIRIICESLRGDVTRGFIGKFSISTWISIFCMVISIIFIFISRKSGDNKK